MNIELTDPSVENAATGCDGPALSVSERTYQALLDRIAARQIGPGEVLEERRLAEELNVSRTPMRAALNRLLGEGILKRLSNGSVVVHAFGVTELLELLQIRQLLEGQAAAMAAGRIPGDKLAAVKARLEDVMRHSAAGGESTWTADNEVHELVAAYCGNKSMAAMIADARRARACATSSACRSARCRRGPSTWPSCRRCRPAMPNGRARP